MSTSLAIRNAASGIRLASKSLAATANNTANLQTEGYRRVSVTGSAVKTGGVRPVTSRAAVPGADLVSDVVDRVSAVSLYRANASVIRAVDETKGQLIDLQA